MPMRIGQKSKEKGARRPLVLLLAARPMRLAAAGLQPRSSAQRSCLVRTLVYVHIAGAI